MNTLATLQQQAIEAAKGQNWAAAIDFNQQIRALYPDDLGALNRLGLAQAQLGNIDEARAAFQKVLSVDKSNTIAKKHLANLKTNGTLATPKFSKVYFIEEPGKTKIAELHRLAGKQVLTSLSIGQPVVLKAKNRYISVETSQPTGHTYIGALPEDLSFRLSKLLESGNTYESFIHSVSASNCSIYIRELTRSAINQHAHSFPLVKSSLAAINDLDEDFLLEDNIPVQAIDTDNDHDNERDSSGGYDTNLNDSEND